MKLLLEVRDDLCGLESGNLVLSETVTQGTSEGNGTRNEFVRLGSVTAVLATSKVYLRQLSP